MTRLPPTTFGSRRPRAPLPALLLAILLSAGGCTSPITDAERIVFFPTAGHLDLETYEWVMPIEGLVYRPRDLSWLREFGFSWLTDGLKEEEAESARTIYERRVDAFLIDGKSNRQIVVRFDGREHTLPPSDASGRFSGQLRLDISRVPDVDGEDGVIEYNAVWPQATAQEFVGRIHLVKPDGVSVISDIDDTIKISNVLDTTRMVRTMFLSKFAAVPGMAEAYREWAEDGATFFYVSSSPANLYEALAAFNQRAEFPPAVFSLKRIGFFDRFMSNLWASSLETKPPAIERILDDFPQRRFILVGDSTEHDPEVYGRIARHRPQQILHIYIRNVTDGSRHDARFQRAFAGIPARQWTLFDDSDALAPLRFHY